MKKSIFWIIIIILTYGLIEALSYGSLNWLKKRHSIEYYPSDVVSARHKKQINKLMKEKTNYLSYSSTLGWTIKKNGASILYRANSAGIRGSKEYSVHPPRGILRISTFGDSFTHCDEVVNEETWQVFMESLDSNMEVINFGVGGYGLDQAYLRYLKDGRQYKSDIVLIGFMSENIFRNVNTFRPFYYPTTNIPLAKPRFEVEGGKLHLIPNQMQTIQDYRTLLLHPRDVLSKLGEKDNYFKKYYISNIFDWSPTVRFIKTSMQIFSDKFIKDKIIIKGQYNETSEAFIVTKKVFDEFYSAALKNKSTPIILVFPHLEDVKRFRGLNEKRYSPLINYFKSKGYAYIDLMDAFETEDLNRLFNRYHYKPYANKLVAEAINQNIADMLAGNIGSLAKTNGQKTAYPHHW